MDKDYIKKTNIVMTVTLWLIGIGLLLYFLGMFLTYARPSSIDLNSLIDSIKSFLQHSVIQIISGIISSFNYVSKNYFKVGLCFFMGIYLLISFFAYPVGPLFKSGSFDFNTRTHNASFDSRSAFLLVSNIIWILAGLALSLGVFNITLKNQTSSFPYPRTGGFNSRLNWTIKRSMFNLKILTGIIVVLGLVIGMLYLIGKFQILSLSLSVLLQIFSIIGLLFMAFKLVSGHPGIMRALEESTLLKLLYHLLFAIPCFVKFMVESIHANAVSTGTTPYIGVLLLEILLIIFYFVIPIMKNKFYTTNLSSRNNTLTKKQAEAGILSGITALDRTISSIKDHVNIDWEYIIKNKLYTNENDEDLTTYLKTQHFKEHYEKNNKISAHISELFSGAPTMTLSVAKTFIQINATRLIEKEIERDKLENEKNEFLEKADLVFTSKILLHKPVYTDIKKIIGNFENLKGDLGTYNYQYGISAWVYLHEQPPSKSYAHTKFTSIINYGDKPNILFNPSKGMLRITNKVGLNDTEIMYQTKNISLQKWNNIVINYDGGTLDVFLNGELVASKNNIIPYMSYDLVTSGSKDGISGGTCSIVYYSGPLGKRQIDFFYNSLKNKNPPLI